MTLCPAVMLHIPVPSGPECWYQLEQLVVLHIAAALWVVCILQRAALHRNLAVMFWWCCTLCHSDWLHMPQGLSHSVSGSTISILVCSHSRMLDVCTGLLISWLGPLL